LLRAALAASTALTLVCLRPALAESESQSDAERSDAEPKAPAVGEVGVGGRVFWRVALVAREQQQVDQNGVTSTLKICYNSCQIKLKQGDPL
jgi:hypothetical protein